MARGILADPSIDPKDWTGNVDQIFFTATGPGNYAAECNRQMGYPLSFTHHWADAGAETRSHALDDVIDAIVASGIKTLFILTSTNDATADAPGIILGDVNADPATLTRVANDADAFQSTTLGNLDKILSACRTNDILAIAWELPRASASNNDEVMGWLEKHAYDGSEGTYTNLIVPNVFDEIGDDPDRSVAEIQAQYQIDGLHTNIHGADAGGALMAAHPAIISAFSGLGTRKFEPTISEVTNAAIDVDGLLTGAGGDTTNGATGSVADGWRLNGSNATTNGSIAGSKVTKTINSEVHDGQRVTLTGNGSGNNTTIFLQQKTTTALNRDYVVGELFEVLARMDINDPDGLINTVKLECRISASGGLNNSRSAYAEFEFKGAPQSSYLLLSDELEVEDPMLDGTTPVALSTWNNAASQFLRIFIIIVYTQGVNGTATLDFFHPFIRNTAAP